jgi:fatty acid desaturase
MTSLESRSFTADQVLESYRVMVSPWPASRSHAERAHLRRVVPSVFVAKLAVLAALLGLSGFGVLATQGLVRIILQICLGAVLAHATELIHQCLHRTATGTASRDQWLGMIIATPLGISFWRYLTDHFRHHKDVTQESFSYNYQRMDSSSVLVRLIGFFLHVSMIDHFVQTLKWISYSTLGRTEEKLAKAGPLPTAIVVRKIRNDYLVMAGLLFLAIIATLAFRTDVLIQLWLIPMIIGWAPIHALIELPEHWKCETSSTNARLNTRSIRAGFIARWYVNNNCNHVGHHQDLSVTMEKLPDYEAKLIEQEPFKYFEESYSRFYFRFFRYLFTGNYC